MVKHKDQLKQYGHWKKFQNAAFIPSSKITINQRKNVPIQEQRQGTSWRHTNGA